MECKNVRKRTLLWLLIAALMCAVVVPVATVSAETADLTLFDSADGISDCTTARIKMTVDYQHDENAVALVTNLSSGAELGKVETLDLSAYQYINMWVYSPAVSTGRFSLDIYNLVDGSQTRNGQVRITVDWQGWKLVSVPASSMADVAWDAVSKWRISTQSTKDDWTNLSDHYLEVQTIWASKDDPYKLASAANEAVVNYNPTTFPTAQNGQFGTTPVKAAEQSFGVKVNGRWEGTFTGTVTLQSCGYLNMWIYVPAETVPEGTTPRLRFRVNDGSTGTETAYSKYVDVDWTGWKLVTIPFSELTSSGASLPDNAVVTKFRMITNETSATPFNTDSTEKIYLDRVWFSQEVPNTITAQLQPENSGTGFYATDTMLILSLDKAATLDGSAAVTVKTSEGTAVANTLCQLAPDKIGVLLDDALTAGTSYTVTLPYGAVYDGTYGCNPETELTFTTEEAGITVSAPGIYNGNNKLGGEFVTAAEVYDQLRSVASVYNTTDAETEVMLIIAVYDTESKELKDVSCIRASVPANTRQVLTTTGAAEAYAVADSGDGVRCFVWETDGLKPLKCVN